MKIQDPVFKPDIERLIDDFIFICFLTGNDFIPHIPSLEIHECASDLLIEVYKTALNKMGAYIVNTDKVPEEFQPLISINDYKSLKVGKGFFMNCPCAKRRFFSKEMNCESICANIRLFTAKASNRFSH